MQVEMIGTRYGQLVQVRKDSNHQLIFIMIILKL